MTVNVGYMVRAPTGHTANTHMKLPKPFGGFFIPKIKIFLSPFKAESEKKIMAFFNSAVGVLQTLVIALGAGLGIWGVINLLEGYGNDNPGAKSQGMKQLMAGGGVALIGAVLVPLLSGLFG